MAPDFTAEELTCQRAPKGQLPYTAPADQVASRIRANDEAGEDCRQKLDRAKMKVEVTREVVEKMNKKSAK